MTVPPRSLTLASPAKINLFLEIHRRRPDGYHTLSTLFQEISLRDTLRARVHATEEMTLTTNVPSLKTDETNLVLRAAKAYKERYPGTPGLAFSLIKRIPLGAGLGGGSSNAAKALLACWVFSKDSNEGLSLIRPFGGRSCRQAFAIGRTGPGSEGPHSTQERRNRSDIPSPLGRGEGEGLKFFEEVGSHCLFPLAKKLGADVPFFLRGGLASAGGVGDRLTHYTPPPRRTHWFVLVFPRVFSSTPVAYRALHFPLTKRRSRLKLTRALRDGAPAGVWSPWLFNRLEEVVLPRLRPVGLAKKALLQAGCLNALMSGSGSSVFGVVDNPTHGRRVMARIRRESWDVWLVSSVVGEYNLGLISNKAGQHGNHGNPGLAPR